MKLCVNCKHFKPSLWCRSPLNGVSPVDGEPKSEWATVSRGSHGKCGPDGLGFEQREVVNKQIPTWWERILWLK